MVMAVEVDFINFCLVFHFSLFYGVHIHQIKGLRLTFFTFKNWMSLLGKENTEIFS